MTYYQLLMSPDKELGIKTLNNVAVNYFELGLCDLSYQIWDELYHGIQGSLENYSSLLPVISCNMGNALRQSGYYEEAYRVLMQGLKRCFDTGAVYAMPELILQLSILSMKLGSLEEANSLYALGKNIFGWCRQPAVNQSMEELMQQNFLLYCTEDMASH